MAREIWSNANDIEGVQRILQSNAQKPQAFEPAPVTGDRMLLRTAAWMEARRLVQQSHGEGDRILATEVRALDDLVKSANLLMERLREWYALHSPDAARATDARQFASAVAANPDRSEVRQLLGLAEEMQEGADLAPADMATLQSFAAALQGIYTAWEDVELRIANAINEVAPNLAVVVGPVIGARLIAQAGSLERLAGFPSGTVQLLGAETALFRHLKEGSLPPKHGTLFQHPHIHQAPPWHRGPLARKLANLASLAAKADAHSKRDLSAELRAGWDEARAKIASKAKPNRKPVMEPRPPGDRAPPSRDARPSRDAPIRGGPPRERGNKPRRDEPKHVRKPWEPRNPRPAARESPPAPPEAKPDAPEPAAPEKSRPASSPGGAYKPRPGTRIGGATGGQTPAPKSFVKPPAGRAPDRPEDRGYDKGGKGGRKDDHKKGYDKSGKAGKGGAGKKGGDDKPYKRKKDPFADNRTAGVPGGKK